MFILIPAGILQFNSGTNHPKLAQTTQNLKAWSPTRLPLLQTPVKSGVPRPPACPAAYKSGTIP